MKEDDKQVPEDFVEDRTAKDPKDRKTIYVDLKQYFDENLLGKVFEL